eukprot:m.164952 g.164952  ORF g.164952 m.164952 type:complete len:225 (+) comp13430_c0_seq3:59-733(+)
MASKKKGKKSGGGKDTVKVALSFEDFTDDDWQSKSQQDTLAWKAGPFSTPQSTRELLLLEPEEIASNLQEQLGLESVDVNATQSIILDIFSQLLWTCKENKLTVLESSAFFTLINNMIDNIREKQFSLEENMTYFRTILKTHAQLSRWDGISDMFDFMGDTVTVVTQHVKRSIFQHYKLYTQVLTTTTEAETQHQAITLTPPIALPPLIESVPASELQHYKEKA